MFKGKHSKENLYIKQLEETINLKDREIADIKDSLANEFQKILTVNESKIIELPTRKVK